MVAVGSSRKRIMSTNSFVHAFRRPCADERVRFSQFSG